MVKEILCLLLGTRNEEVRNHVHLKYLCEGQLSKKFLVLLFLKIVSLFKISIDLSLSKR